MSGTRKTPSRRDLKYYDLAGQRMKAAAAYNRASKKVRDTKTELETIEAKIREELIADKLESQRVRGYNYTPSSRFIADIKDRDSYLEYASLPENRDLLHKRISMEAAQERWDAVRRECEAEGLDAKTTAKRVAAAIPGVLPGSVPTLSVSKAKSLRGAK